MFSEPIAPEVLVNAADVEPVTVPASLSNSTRTVSSNSVSSTRDITA